MKNRNFKILLVSVAAVALGFWVSERYQERSRETQQAAVQASLLPVLQDALAQTTDLPARPSSILLPPGKLIVVLEPLSELTTDQRDDLRQYTLEQTQRWRESQAAYQERELAVEFTDETGR